MFERDSFLLFLDFCSSGFNVFRYCGSGLSKNLCLMRSPWGGKLSRGKSGIDRCSWLQAKGKKIWGFCGGVMNSGVVGQDHWGE